MIKVHLYVRKRRHPEFNAIHDMKETNSLRVGLKFTKPSEFKDALRLYAIQQGFDYTFLHNEKARVFALCKKRSG